MMVSYKTIIRIKDHSFKENPVVSGFRVPAIEAHNDYTQLAKLRWMGKNMQIIINANENE